MAKKSSKKATKKSNKLLWFILCILSAVLILITVSKMGIFGVVSNNILTYLFGSLYIIVIATMFSYGVYTLFIKDNHEIPLKSLCGVAVLVFTILFLNAYIVEDVRSFPAYFGFVKDNFLNIFKDEVLPEMGGILPDFFNVLFLSLMESQGTL
ncbi:MAG: hypothetical protein J6Z03_04890, partial [Erysipelotrichaceae bacterium]|nr:hypothetical protein [Erysipelotrichaceae bacterium]